MRRISIDASRWRSGLDFFNSLKDALGSPEWHGDSIDALIDSIFYGGINQVNLPFEIRIENMNKVSDALTIEIESYIHILLQAADEALESRNFAISFDSKN